MPKAETDAAYAAIKKADTPLAQRLLAHAVILRYGMPACGEIAREERMAEALGDLCVAVALLMTAAGSIKYPR